MAHHHLLQNLLRSLLLTAKRDLTAVPVINCTSQASSSWIQPAPYRSIVTVIHQGTPQEHAGSQYHTSHKLWHSYLRQYAQFSNASLQPSSTLPIVTTTMQTAATLPAVTHSSPHPPMAVQTPDSRGSIVQYPFPVEYYMDREAVVYNMKGEPTGIAALPGSVFNVPVRVDILHRVVRWIRSVWRQGTHKAKTRAEVSGGGKKPWNQKGTGRARHGSIRSPIWIGGGAAHGPRPRSHAHKLPLSIQLLGYKCALSAKANEGRLIVVDSLVPDLTSTVDGTRVVKTKSTQQQLKKLLETMPYQTALLVDSGEDALDGGTLLRRGARNLPWVGIMPWQQVTVYHLLKYNALIITKPALHAMAARLQLPPTRNPISLRRRAWYTQQAEGYQAALEQLLYAQAATQTVLHSAVSASDNNRTVSSKLSA